MNWLEVILLAVVGLVVVYAAARLITHAVLKTRQEFHSNGGDGK